ncbi:unnamed protein product [Rotaria sp. Silwood2]|nr:unnamed protein product [Rotaria sp. Silwood2]CAF3398425.1 unnamed protein product [Rotaria sp. Silwood2]
MSITKIPINISSISKTNKSQSFRNKQLRWAKNIKFEDIILYVLASIAGLVFIGFTFDRAYHVWKKNRMNGGAITIFVMDLLVCEMLIYWLIAGIYVLILKYCQQHQQYHLRESIESIDSSNSIKIIWFSKRYLQKLKTAMNEVLISEHHHFNV